MGRILLVSDSLTPKLKFGEKKINQAVAATMSYYAPQVEGHARVNAPWNDQTGNARQGLTGRPFREGGNHGIDLFHRMPYGIWLEVRWSGKYQIIMPTVILWGERIMRDSGRIFRMLQ